MHKNILFLVSILALYLGGFAFDELGPIVYSLLLLGVLSAPLLFKLSLWKKIILILPLLLLRIIGKYVLLVFGKNAFYKIMAKYGLIEKRFNKLIQTFEDKKARLIGQWRSTPLKTQTYLFVIFLPIAASLTVLVVLIKIIRLKFLQIIIEKIFTIILKWLHLKSINKANSGNKNN